MKAPNPYDPILLLALVCAHQKVVNVTAQLELEQIWDEMFVQIARSDGSRIVRYKHALIIFISRPDFAF